MITCCVGRTGAAMCMPAFGHFDPSSFPSKPRFAIPLYTSSSRTSFTYIHRTAMAIPLHPFLEQDHIMTIKCGMESCVGSHKLFKPIDMIAPAQDPCMYTDF
jgi:hypothetical protein